MRHAALAAVLLTFIAGTAAASTCTRAKRGTSDAEKARLATVSKDDAQKAAIESLDAGDSATVINSELEVERRCLVWSFDIRIPGRRGMEEVQVDAGTGRVLRHEHEDDEDEDSRRARGASRQHRSPSRNPPR
jgi:hypothetical protein